MPILNIKIEQAGLSGISPKVIYIDTDDTQAEVTATGYLNALAEQGLPLSEKSMALVTTKESAGRSVQVGWYDLAYASGNWSLTPSSSLVADGSITLAKLASGISPSHVIKFAGQPTTTGGAAAEAFTVTGALATDLAFVQVVDDGTAGVTVLQAAVSANTLTVTFSADPGADTVINYQIIRAAS